VKKYPSGRRPGFARAFRILLALQALAAVPAYADIVLLVEDSASIYERAGQGFLLGFQSADRIETISINQDQPRDRALLAARSTNPRLVVAIGTKAATAAKTKFPGSPILYCLALDPSRRALTGGNIGGLALDVDVKEQMALIQRALPHVTRIGVIYDEPVSGSTVREARQYLNSNVKLIARDVKNATQAAQAIEALSGAVDAFWLLWDPVIANAANFRRLVEFSVRNKVALIAPATPFVEAGALMSISADYFETGRRAGVLARDIVEGKSRMSDIAAKPPIGPVVTVNSEVARLVGIEFPPDLHAEVLAK
jgi:putative tryptophan/tyrosine transport system substrate-binding protein